MNWDEIQSGLVAAFELAAGSEIKASWNRRASGWRADSHIKLDVLSVERVGQSEILRRYDEDQDKIIQVERGARVLVVQVSAESTSQELSRSALAIAEKVRSRLALREVRALIEATGIAVPTSGPVFNASYTDPGDAGRHVSRGVFDVRFNAMNYEIGELLDRVVRVVVEHEITPHKPSRLPLELPVDLWAVDTSTAEPLLLPLALPFDLWANRHALDISLD